MIDFTLKDQKIAEKIIFSRADRDKDLESDTGGKTKALLREPENTPRYDLQKIYNKKRILKENKDRDISKDRDIEKDSDFKKD